MTRGRRLSAVALGVACLALARPAPGTGQAAPDPMDVLEAAAERYADVERLCADFVQHLAVPLLGEENTGRGRLCQARPDRFAMRFSEPEGDRIVADGDWVWVYYPSLDRGLVTRFSMASAPGGFDFHREFLADPAQKYAAEYRGTEGVAGHAAHHIALTPLAETSYRRAEVWVDTDRPLLRQVRIEEENGSVRTVTLLAIEMNPTVSDDFFAFTPPRGAQVITR